MAGRALPLLTAACVVLLLAAAAYGCSSLLAGASVTGPRAAVEHLPLQERSVVVTGEASLATSLQATGATRAALAEVLGSSSNLRQTLSSDDFRAGSEGQPDAVSVRLTWSSTPELAPLTAGRAARPDATQREVVAPATTWRDGQPVYGRLPGSDGARVVGRVVGTYDASVLRAQLATSSSDDAQALLVADASSLSAVEGPVKLRWLAAPQASTLDAAEVRRLQAAVERLVDDGRPELPNFLRASSDLPDAFATLAGPVQAARSAVLVPMVQMLALAVVALLLVLRQLDDLAAQAELVRARGLSTWQLALPAAALSVCCVVPALLLAPWLGGQLVGAAAALSGSPVPPSSGPGGRGPAALLALAAGAALFAALLARMRQRGAVLPFARLYRGGIDGALLVVAAAGCWQLVRYGAVPNLDGPAGTAGPVDPVVVLVPALALLAGGVMLLRALPRVTHLAARSGRRGRGPVLPVGTSMLDQRPLRSAAAVFALVLAVSVGVLASAYATAWQRSQADQADFTVGADARIAGPVDAAAVARLAGSSDASLMTPVVEAVGQVDFDDVQVVAMDAGSAPAVLRWRPDLRPTSTAALFESLGRAPAPPAGIALAAGSSDLRIVARATATEGFTTELTLTVVVRDGYGLLRRLAPFTVSTNGLAVTSRIPLTAEVTAGWSVQAIELSFQPPRPVAGVAKEPSVSLVVTSLTAQPQTGEISLSVSRQTPWLATLGSVLRPRVSSLTGDADALLRLVTRTSLSDEPVSLTVRPTRDGRLATGQQVPVLITSALSRQAELTVGSTVPLQVADAAPVTGRVTAVVPAIMRRR